MTKFTNFLMLVLYKLHIIGLDECIAVVRFNNRTARVQCNRCKALFLNAEADELAAGHDCYVVKGWVKYYSFAEVEDGN